MTQRRNQYAGLSIKIYSLPVEHEFVPEEDFTRSDFLIQEMGAVIGEIA